MAKSRFRKFVSVNINCEAEAEIDSDTVIDFLTQCSITEFNLIIAASKKQAIESHGIALKTLIDVMKFDLITEAFKKYSILELEEKLKD